MAITNQARPSASFAPYKRHIKSQWADYSGITWADLPANLTWNGLDDYMGGINNPMTNQARPDNNYNGQTRP